MAQPYQLITNDNEEFDIYFGEPHEDSEDGDDAKKETLNENWIPKGWKLVESFEDEKSAKKKRDELREKARKKREAEREKTRGKEAKQTTQ